MTWEDLLNDRPNGADEVIVNDLPNEYGIPNRNPDGTGDVDNHDVLTGSTPEGTVDSGATCNDWTSSSADSGSPRIGHAFPRSMGGEMGAPNWISDHTAPGCLPGTDGLDGSFGSRACVGCSGGYGGIYCLALTP